MEIVGTSLTLASGNPAAETDPATAAPGVAGTASRSDHVHPIANPATPSTQAVGDAAAQGAGAGFATDTHLHALTLGARLPVRKAATETVNNSSVLQADDELLAALVANATYAFKLVLFLTTTSAAAFKYSLSFPAAVGALRYGVSGSAGDDTGVATWTAWATAADVAQNLVTGAVGTKYAVTIEGTVINGVNAGNISLNWAQQVATVVNTQVDLGSYLQLTRIS